MESKIPSKHLAWDRDKFKKAGNREQLHAETLSLKQSMNNYKAENIVIKSKIHQLEKEIERKGKLIQKIIEQKNNDQGISSLYSRRVETDTSLVISYKKQVKELREELKIKEDELADMKRNLKGMRVEEIEQELSIRGSECAKLREVIEQVNQDFKDEQKIRQVQEIVQKLQQQNIMLTNMKKENDQLIETIKRKDDEANIIQENAVTIETKMNKISGTRKDFIRNKKRIGETRKEIDKLKQEINTIIVGKAEKGQNVYQTKIDELMRKQQEMQGMINEKENYIKNLENKAREKNNSKQAEINSQKEKIGLCEKEIEELKRAKTELNIIKLEDLHKTILEIKLYLLIEGIPYDSIQKVYFLIIYVFIEYFQRIQR